MPSDGKKQFKEEQEIREKCSDNEDCKGFTEKTCIDGKVKCFLEILKRLSRGKDRRAFVKNEEQEDKMGPGKRNRLKQMI